MAGLLRRRRFAARAAALAVVALVTGTTGVLTHVADAQSPGVDGNDFSWPQCPKGVGNGMGNPLPAGHRRFEIVGLTNGTGMHVNPCLAQQWRYARAHADFVDGYAVVTYPTRRQRLDARTGHIRVCRTLSCRLRNSGWAQASTVDTSLRQVAGRPPLVWVDVEPRSQQPWSSSRWRNRTVIRAMVAGLQAAGYRVGVYSTSYMWHAIAGYSTSLPEWVPSGSSAAGCRLPLSHGRVWIGQFAHYYRSGAGYDENILCRAAPLPHRMFQPAHPWVTTSRDVRTGRTFVRYSGGRATSLRQRLLSSPQVVVARVWNGDLPVFVGVATGHQLTVGTLTGAWSPAAAPPGASCSHQAAGVVQGSLLWVGCRSRTGTLLLGNVQLGDDGAPAGPLALGDYGGQLSGTPTLTVVNGDVVATAAAPDGTVWQRTADTPWEPSTAEGTPAAADRARL